MPARRRGSPRCCRRCGGGSRRREKRGLTAELRHQIKTDVVSVEVHRLLDVCDPQVHVTHARAGRQRVERRLRRPRQDAEQIVEVERPGPHLRDAPLPQLARAIPVHLNAVMVGIAQVKRLADEVVGGAGERNPRLRRVGEPAREVGPLGQKQREVEEPAVVVGRPRAGRLDQAQELDAARTEARLARLPREELDPIDSR